MCILLQKPNYTRESAPYLISADTIRKVAVSVGYSKLKPEQEKFCVWERCFRVVTYLLATVRQVTVLWTCFVGVLPISLRSPFFKLQPQARQQSISTTSTCTRAVSLLDVGASAAGRPGSTRYAHSRAMTFCWLMSPDPNLQL